MVRRGLAWLVELQGQSRTVRLLLGLAWVGLWFEIARACNGGGVASAFWWSVGWFGWWSRFGGPAALKWIAEAFLVWVFVGGAVAGMFLNGRLLRRHLVGVAGCLLWGVVGLGLAVAAAAMAGVPLTVAGLSSFQAEWRRGGGVPWDAASMLAVCFLVWLVGTPVIVTRVGAVLWTAWRLVVWGVRFAGFGLGGVVLVWVSLESIRVLAGSAGPGQRLALAWVWFIEQCGLVALWLGVPEEHGIVAALVGAGVCVGVATVVVIRLSAGWFRHVFVSMSQRLQFLAEGGEIVDAEGHVVATAEGRLRRSERVQEEAYRRHVAVQIQALEALSRARERRHESSLERGEDVVSVADAAADGDGAATSDVAPGDAEDVLQVTGNAAEEGSGTKADDPAGGPGKDAPPVTGNGAVDGGGVPAGDARGGNREDAHPATGNVARESGGTATGDAEGGVVKDASPMPGNTAEAGGTVAGEPVKGNEEDAPPVTGSAAEEDGGTTNGDPAGGESACEDAPDGGERGGGDLSNEEQSALEARDRSPDVKRRDVGWDGSVPGEDSGVEDSAEETGAAVDRGAGGSGGGGGGFDDAVAREEMDLTGFGGMRVLDTSFMDDDEVDGEDAALRGSKGVEALFGGGRGDGGADGERRESDAEDVFGIDRRDAD